jgi:hypothetical protein
VFPLCVDTKMLLLGDLLKVFGAVVEEVEVDVVDGE